MDINTLEKEEWDKYIDGERRNSPSVQP